MMTPLPLRDVHPGASPSWWPPAPGWWMLAMLILTIVVALALWWLRRRRRNEVVLRLFDDALVQAGTTSLQVAAMSSLLRRAARLRNPAADRLEGDAWLHFLNQGLPDQPFSGELGSLLLDGGFRANVAETAAADLRAIVRRRYLSWMQWK
jgi:hypothetical protein